MSALIWCRRSLINASNTSLTGQSVHYGTLPTGIGRLRAVWTTFWAHEKSDFALRFGHMCDVASSPERSEEGTNGGSLGYCT